MLKVLMSERRLSFTVFTFFILPLFFCHTTGFSMIDHKKITVQIEPDCSVKKCPKGKRGHRGHRGHKGNAGKSLDLPSRDEETENLKFVLRGNLYQTEMDPVVIILTPYIVLPDQTVLLGDGQEVNNTNDIVYFTFDPEDPRYSQFLNGPFLGQYIIGWQTSGDWGFVGGRTAITMSRSPFADSVILQSDIVPGQPSGSFGYYIPPS